MDRGTGSGSADADQVLVPIGELARRTGLSVKTIRFWSDEGLVPPSERTPAGYRLYGSRALTRLAFVRTLRDLGVDLTTVQRVLDREVTVAEVAAAHAEALDTHIRTLRLQRIVLRAVADRGATPKEMEIMNKLAKMSAEERRHLVTDFLDEIFADVAGGTVEQRMRQAPPELPDDPTPAQVEAWVELAELIQDPDFRARTRAMSVQGAEAGDEPDERAMHAHKAIAEKAGQALADGLDPAAEQARPLVDELATGLAGDGDDPASAEFRRELAERLATFTDRRVERYWQLIGVINGWGGEIPSTVPTYEWFIAGLRASTSG